MSAPKPPSPKKVNPYEGMMSDPDFAAAAEELGFSNVNKDHEVREIKEYLLRQTVDSERRDKDFRKAEKQLYREGVLTSDDPTNRKDYINSLVESGEYTKKEAKQNFQDRKAEEGKNFFYADETNTDWELQKIYDRQATVKGDRAQKKYDKKLDKQYKEMLKSQEKQAAENRALMEEMMNQPIYSARQASLAPVQAKPKAANPIPVAPAPPPAMTIKTAPAPELVSMGNPMGIVRQSTTSAQRSRRRTRGTSSLT